MFGLPAGMAYYLDRKYNAIESQARSDAIRANAAALNARSDANLNAVRAGLMPAESRAQIGLQGAQANLAAANARNTDEETKYVGPRAEALIRASDAGAFANYGQGEMYRSNARATDRQGALSLSPTDFGAGLSPSYRDAVSRFFKFTGGLGVLRNMRPIE